MSKKKLTNNQAIMILIALMGVFIFIPLLFPFRLGASQGSHTGYVTAVERNSNVLWPSNLVYFKTSRESTQEDAYCVNDPELQQTLSEAQRENKLVTLSYKNNFFMWKSDCNGGASIVTNIE